MDSFLDTVKYDEPGLEIGIRMFAADIEPTYRHTPELPYHNWREHIGGGFLEVMRLIKVSQSLGVEIDALEAGISYIGHDAGGRFIMDKSFRSLEEQSAGIVDRTLERRRFGISFRRLVRSNIISTIADVPCVRPAEKIVNRADIKDVAREYYYASRGAVLLLHESVILTGEPFEPKSLSPKLEKSCGKLRLILAKDLALSPNDADYYEQFAPNSQANLERLGNESPASLQRQHPAEWSALLKAA